MPGNDRAITVEHRCVDSREIGLGSAQGRLGRAPPVTGDDEGGFGPSQGNVDESLVIGRLQFGEHRLVSLVVLVSRGFTRIREGVELVVRVGAKRPRHCRS